MNASSPSTLSLCIHISFFLLASSVAAGTSLWGKKIQLNGRPCMWQLQPDAAVPALTDLSVCILLRHNIPTKWTGFVYQAPGGRNVELGLEGAGSQLTVWLFGEALHVEWELKPSVWHSVCLTWSSSARRLRTYVDGTVLHDAPVDPSRPQQLAPNGTLTLGVSHYVDSAGEVQTQSGNKLLGEIGLFRMWSRELSAEELQRQRCADGDGDVVSWDERQWKHSCPPVPDHSLHCEVQPDTFFRVNMTLDASGNATNPKEIIEKWVTETLERNGTMVVLNLIITENGGRYFCTFHIQEFSTNNVSEVIVSLKTALTSKYENGSISIAATDVVIKHILPQNCLEETMSTIYGQYIWAETFPQINQVMGCKKPKSERAYRLCKLNIETDTTSWAEPDMTRCVQLVTISDLDNVTVTPDNAAEVVDIIQNLVDVQLGNSSELSSSELDSVVGKLNEVVTISVIDPAVCGDIVTIIADILLSETDVTSVSNTVLQMTDRMGDNMDFQGESVSLTAPSLALAMVNADAGGFRGLTFGVSSASSHLDPKTHLNQSFVSGLLSDTDATISLPFALSSFWINTTRIQFQFYATDELFQDPHTTNATQSSWTLNSYVISASINNSLVSDLKDRVVVTFRHQKPVEAGDNVQCVFWDFQGNGGQGGWNSTGCEARHVSAHQTSCLCDHLTHFAVLLDVSRTPISEADSRILTVISYIGCGISSIFLGITLLTYICFDNLRRDYPSKILINLSAALLGLSLVFLLDSWLSSFSNYGLCITTAAALHYFLLASFTWMGLEAVHMYIALVKVFNTYVPSYILKFSAAGWGIPLVIVSLVLAIDIDAYGNTSAEEATNLSLSNEPFCWLQNDVVFYVTVVAFVLLILLCNISVFVVVLIQIRRMRANNPSANGSASLQDLRAVASLTVLLGLTWSVGFFSFGPGKVALMYLFSICNTLQGFFVFVFHCLMKENVRKQWRIHLCCGRFRLTGYSDWSRTVTAGGRSRKNILINSAASSDTSSNMKVSGLTSSWAPNYHRQGA